MTRAKDISKIVSDADFGGTLDVAGVVTANAGVVVDNIKDSANNQAISISSGVVNFNSAPTGTGFTAGQLIKHAEVTTESGNITALTIDLPTTDDFSHLKCFIHGIGVSTAGDFWEFQARDSNGNSYRTGTSDYRYTYNYWYVNTSAGAAGAAGGGDTNGHTRVRFDDGMVGTYGDIGDLELEIDIFNNRGTGIANHSPRFSWRRQASKRHQDEWTYSSIGTGVVIPFIEINQFKLFRSGSNTFKIYGYELYKVK